MAEEVRGLPFRGRTLLGLFFILEGLRLLGVYSFPQSVSREQVCTVNGAYGPDDPRHVQCKDTIIGTLRVSNKEVRLTTTANAVVVLPSQEGFLIVPHTEITKRTPRLCL